MHITTWALQIPKPIGREPQHYAFLIADDGQVMQVVGPYPSGKLAEVNAGQCARRFGNLPMPSPVEGPREMPAVDLAALEFLDGHRGRKRKSPR
jgi:hypothetical protein